MTLNQNNVYLSFGRHGRYGYDTAIERSSMLEAFLSGQQLAAELPACETIYFSPIARAVQTAQFRALGMRCSRMIETEFLTENVPTFTVRKFVNQLLANTDASVRHYHFVTHLPVVEKLGLPDLGAGEICLCSATDWEEMLSNNFKVQIMHNPLPEVTANLLQKIGYIKAEFEKAPTEDIYRCLQQAF